MIHKLYANKQEGDGQLRFCEIADGCADEIRRLFKEFYTEDRFNIINILLLKETIVGYGKIGDYYILRIDANNTSTDYKSKDPNAFGWPRFIRHLKSAVSKYAENDIDSAWREIIYVSSQLFFMKSDLYKKHNKTLSEDYILHALHASELGIDIEPFKEEAARKAISKQNSKASASRNGDIYKWIYAEYEANLSLEKPLRKVDFCDLYAPKIPLKFERRTISAKLMNERLCKKYPKGCKLAK